MKRHITIKFTLKKEDYRVFPPKFEFIDLGVKECEEKDFKNKKHLEGFKNTKKA